MGCGGCELWNEAAGVRHCYAGALTERWAGKPGWPAAFAEPAAFLSRFASARGWPDLRGMARDRKPWLDGYPRTVFLNDMGDTFTESLPLDWLDPVLEGIAQSRHVFIILTKRASRLYEWVRHCEAGPVGVPENVWLCVSVTSRATLPRLHHLLKVREALPRHVLGLSVEPLLEDLALGLREPDGQRRLREAVNWVKLGGESNQGAARARVCHLGWLRGVRDFFGPWASVFVKQLGSRPIRGAGVAEELTLKDGHGGDWDEWPEDLRVREMPPPLAAAA